MATADLVCSSCGETEGDLYFCETCSNSEESSNEKELLCELCLGPHVGKGHQIQTSKGQEPLICSQHRRFHSEYCKTCDVTFCSKCLGTHSKHELGRIEQRALEIKKEVFEMLTKLELDEKPLRLKKESISQLKKSHETDQSKLRELFEKEIEKLRQVGLKRIDENLSQIEKEEQEVIDGIDRLLSLQKSSRELLILTNPHLIKDFKQIKRCYEDACEKLEKDLRAEYLVTTSEFCGVKDVLDKMGTEVDEKLKSKFEKKLTQSLKFAVKGFDCSNFIFLVEKRKLKVDKLIISTAKELTCEKIGEVELDEDVELCFSINTSHFLCSCIICTNYSSYRIDVTKSNKIEMSKLTLPFSGKIVCPYILDNWTSDVYVCYFSEDEEVLQFSHDASFKIKCFVPKWQSLEINGNRLSFKTVYNEILIVDPRKGTREEIEFSEHGVDSISHVTLFGRHLWIWSVETKSVVCMCKEGEQWNVIETHKWIDPTKSIPVTCLLDFYLLPALKSNTRFREDFHYLFLVYCY